MKKYKKLLKNLERYCGITYNISFLRFFFVRALLEKDKKYLLKHIKRIFPKLRKLKKNKSDYALKIYNDDILTNLRQQLTLFILKRLTWKIKEISIKP